jgi:hypothetical protein
LPGDGSVSAYQVSTNDLRKSARDAGTPAGYKKEFTDLTATTEEIGYLTYKNIEDGTYSVDQCAAFCDSEKFCLGFNIYFERDPSQNPATDCPDPDPITNVKCAIFGYPVAAASATNAGQYRQDFHVVSVGSNGKFFQQNCQLILTCKLGYSKTSPICKAAPAVANFNAPANLPAAINAPYIQKDGKDYDTYNGMRLFNDGPFDPALCAAACEAQTAFDKQHLADANGEYKPCNFFTAYVLTKNGAPLGTYCALYTQFWDSSYATNTGYYYGDDTYSVVCAASYSATTPDSGTLPAA